MGYELHITRASDWTESESAPIHLDEWKVFVAAHPEFRMDNFAEATTPQGATIRCDSDGIAVWTTYSKHEEGRNMAWFDHYKGSIVVKSPDGEIRDKMKGIAEYFRARVFGDEGEEY